MITAAERQGTAPLRHLVRETTLKNIHPSFNQLQHFIWPANAMDEPAKDTEGKKPWSEVIRFMTVY